MFGRSQRDFKEKLRPYKRAGYYLLLMEKAPPKRPTRRDKKTRNPITSKRDRKPSEQLHRNLRKIRKGGAFG